MKSHFDVDIPVYRLPYIMVFFFLNDKFNNLLSQILIKNIFIRKQLLRSEFTRK